ncbi:hypothetical protein J4E91_004330 [Alternaria rosae]|nr:hypothetical protein J4E91_004330 [Alternaria rosae]
MDPTTPTDVPLGSRLISIKGLRKSWESEPIVHIVMNEDEPLSNVWQKIEGYWSECLLLKDFVNNE